MVGCGGKFVKPECGRGQNLLTYSRPNKQKAASTGERHQRDGGRRGERGHVDEVDRIDLDALAERWGVSLAPMWIREAASPGVDGSTVWPTPVSIADLGDGTHLSYAVQWFVFTLIGLGGFPLVLVRLAHRDPEVA